MGKRTGSKGSSWKDPPADSSVRLRVIEGEAGRFVPTFDLSDTGNAERLAFRFGHRIRYVTSWNEYVVYTGTHWKRDIGGVEVGKLAKLTISTIGSERHLSAGERHEAEKWRRRSSSMERRRAMVNLLKHEDGMAVDHTELDSDHWLLNVANGTLDLRTSKLRGHDPKDLITKCISVKYDPKASAPLWKGVLEKVLPDPSVRKFLQCFLGYALTGDVSERTFVVMYGGGKNGKSVVLRAVQDVMGEYAQTTAPTLLMAKDADNHPIEVADLCGARLAVSNETRKGRGWDEEQVKRLTGNDVLKARRMRENFWSFLPTHKLVVASNHKPRVRDATDSFWDRLALINFSVRIAEKDIDRHLGDKLRHEREGILAQLVEGCRQWRHKGLNPPLAVRAATKEYRNEEDIVGRFLDDCCVFEPNATVRTSDLVRANKIWSDDLNLYHAREKDLVEALHSRSCPAKRWNDGRGWSGVRLEKKWAIKR